MNIKNLYIVITLLTYYSNLHAQIKFTRHQIGIKGQAISGLSIIDLDHDIDKDIICCLKNENKLVYWENTGELIPKFSKKIIDSSLKTPFYVYSDDIDKNGFNDVSVGLISEGRLFLYKNLGKEQNMIRWEKEKVGINFPGIHGISIVDMNNDNNKDVVAAGAFCNQVAWWEQNLLDSVSVFWTRHIICDNFKLTQSIFPVDIDQDGDMDVLSASSGNNEISLFINKMDQFQKWEKLIIDTNFRMAHWVCAYDIDLDKKVDIVGAACQDNEVSWWKNEGNLKFSKQIISMNIPCPLTVIPADIDNDSDTDFIATAWDSGEIYLFENNKNSYITHIICDNFNGAWPLYLTDLDLDGDIDIVSAGDVLNKSLVSAPLTWWENMLIKK